MWFTDISIVCETSDQSFTEASEKWNVSSVWQSSSRLWRNDAPPHLSRPSASGSLGTVKLEAERLSGSLGHSNIKSKGMKNWWPSSPFSFKTRRNIKLSLKYMTQRWLFICSSSVLTSHVGLCYCSKEDDLVQNISAPLWKTVYEWLNNESLVLYHRSVP